MGAAGAALCLKSNLFAAETSGGGVPRRKFGRHDEMVSSMALGGFALGTAPSVEEATRIAHAAIDLGLNFFDNSWDYHGGRAEEWMGAALKGKRDQVFLMTKVHTQGQGKDVAHKMLEDSLRRLGTDHLDLWQIHAISKQSEIDSAFAPGGVIEALDEAKKQGKVRYVGFTGHLDPHIHAAMLDHHYPFDSVQMPLGAFDGSNVAFQKVVLPKLLEQGIAPLAMKTLGGNAQCVRDGVIQSEEALRYSLSLPITALVSGIDSMEHLQRNARAAIDFKPMSKDEKSALEMRCAAYKQYEPYRHWVYRDGHGAKSMVA